MLMARLRTAQVAAAAGPVCRVRGCGLAVAAPKRTLTGLAQPPASRRGSDTRASVPAAAAGPLLCCMHGFRFPPWGFSKMQLD